LSPPWALEVADGAGEGTGELGSEFPEELHPWNGRSGAGELGSEVGMEGGGLRREIGAGACGAASPSPGRGDGSGGSNGSMPPSRSLTAEPWMDVWLGDEALYSHCVAKDASVSEMVTIGLQQTMVPRLSNRATLELQEVQGEMANLQLTRTPDQRTSPFFRENHSLDSGEIYHLLKSRGQQPDNRAAFVWQNSAPPRVQLFMWLLTQRRIQCRSVLHRKHVLQDAICEICHQEEETPEHIISGCTLGSQFWHKLNMPDMIGRDITTIYMTTTPAEVPRDEFSAFVALCCWQL